MDRSKRIKLEANVSSGELARSSSRPNMCPPGHTPPFSFHIFSSWICGRSFPSKNSQAKAAEAAQLAYDVQQGRAEVVKLEKRIEAAEEGRYEHSNRSSRLEHFKRLKTETGQLHGRLETLKENDPVEIAKQDKAISQAKQASMRWVDNIIECRTYLVRKRGMSSKEVANTLQQLGVQGELDYLK